MKTILALLICLLAVSPAMALTAKVIVISPVSVGEWDESHVEVLSGNPTAQQIADLANGTINRLVYTGGQAVLTNANNDISACVAGLVFVGNALGTTINLAKIHASGCDGITELRHKIRIRPPV